MKRKKKRTINKKTIIIVGIILILLIIVIIQLVTNNDTTTDEMGNRLENYGYTIGEDEDAFYQKITTNNTLDDYYNDISNNKETNYQEYYVSKTSYDFIELKMSYSDKITKILNVTSDLTTKEIEYNFELSYNEIYLLLEGTLDDSFTCTAVTERNVNDEVISTYCNTIKSDLIDFTTERNKILSDTKIQKLLGSK